MTLLILAVQVALPLVLIGWVAFLPASSLSCFALQAAGTGVLLFALARVGQWAVPIWWLPWAYGVLLMLAVLAWILRKGFAGAPLVPDAPSGWAGLTLSVVLLVLGGWYGARALAGHRLLPVEIVDIAKGCIMPRSPA